MAFRTQNGRKFLRKLQLLVSLFNTCQSGAVYASKTLFLANAIMFGSFGIALIHQNTLLAMFCLTVHFSASISYKLLYDRVFNVPVLVECLKADLAVHE